MMNLNSGTEVPPLYRFYRFDTEDLEEWVGDVELRNDGKVRVSTRGIDKNGNVPPWEHIEIYSNHDLFGKPL